MLFLAIFCGAVRMSKLVLLLGAATAARISERAISGDAFQSLDGAWSVQAQGSTAVLPATVPGDLITDLEVANVIGDPL